MSEQLQLDLEAACTRLRDQLVDHRRRPVDGPARLMVALARRGLDPGAVRSAARLVLELDAKAARETPGGLPR